MKDNAKVFVEKMREVIARQFEVLPYAERRAKLGSQKTPFPERFYHYRGADGPNDERNLRDLLVHSKLYLRAPADFNDPFECRFKFGALADTAPLYDHLLQAANAQGATPAELAELPNGLLRMDRATLEAAAIRSTEAHLQNVGIFCFCESDRDVLMWGHYGQSHRGVCVELDVTEGVRTFGICQKVRYEGPMPTVNYPSPGLEIIQPMLRKTERWGYEQEWRIAIPSGAHQHIDFPPSAVKSVMYGCAADGKAKALIDKLLGERRAAGHPSVKEISLKRVEGAYLLADA